MRRERHGNYYDESIYLSKLWLASGSLKAEGCRVLQMRGKADGAYENDI